MTLSSTGPVTYALEVAISQGSTTDEVVVGYHSSTSVLLAYADSVTTTETNVPTGVSIQTITTSTCTTAGAIITTTSSGSTVTTEVPELCTHGLLFLIFGIPGFHSSSDLPSLCHKAFAFPLGIIWRVLCPSVGPPTFSFASVDPGKLPPGGGPPGENPNDGKPDDEKPTESQRPSQTQSSGRTTQSSSQTTQSPSQTTQSTMTSSASATPTRYVVMPLVNTPQSAIDAIFAPFAQRKNVTPAKRRDGSVKFFVSELNDTEASAISAKSDFTIVQESNLDIELTDDEGTDPDANGSSIETTNVKSRSEMGSRSLLSRMGSRGEGLVKRIPLQGWAEKITTWSLAMISLVPGLQLPNYGLDEIYPYYFADPIESGGNVRVYLLDTGMNMRHPEFNGRLKPGITIGQTQSDWNIDWLFPTVDPNEGFFDHVNGRIIRENYEYSYIDPDSPNPSGGIHPAYSDFRFKDVNYGKLTPHGTRISGFILGDDLGQAQSCRYTVVKLPQYTSGVRDESGVYSPDYPKFPLFSVRDALILIIEDIMERKEQGEDSFVVSSALGYIFGSDPEEHPVSDERGFSTMWENVLNWFDDNGVTIVASAGNARRVDSNGNVERNSISLIPAQLFHNPRIVVGSVTLNAMAHPQSQGYIGDGILTAFAPSAGALVVSSDPSGAYIYTFLDPRVSAVTSYACGITVGFVAQAIGLGYSGNAIIPPDPGERPNEYAYRMVSTESKPRIPGGPPIIHNNAPLQLYQDCGGPGGYRKRDGSCPLTRIDLPTGTAALPVSISAAIMTGDGGQFGGTAAGQVPTLSAAIEGIIGEIQGVGADNASSTLTVSTSKTATATISCAHAADPQNTCAAIANSPGWCVCGDSQISYAVQTNTNQPCGWTTQPPTTSFDCSTPTPTNLPSSTASPITTTTTTANSAPSPLANAGIAIWLQQYSNPSGAEVATWFAYSYTPGDTNLGSACTSNTDGMAAIPNKTPVANELSIYPSRMSISAYGRKLLFEAYTITKDGETWLLGLYDAGTANLVCNCEMVADAKGVDCGAEYVLTPRVVCEWAN